MCINSNGKEGVISVISFPLGQDPNAVSKAISNLLNEGWQFEQLTVTNISLKRVWEAEFGGAEIVEARDKK